MECLLTQAVCCVVLGLTLQRKGKSFARSLRSGLHIPHTDRIKSVMGVRLSAPAPVAVEPAGESA